MNFWGKLMDKVRHHPIGSAYPQNPYARAHPGVTASGVNKTRYLPGTSTLRYRDPKSSPKIRNEISMRT